MATCKWFIKSARDFCHADAVPGEKYCNQHRGYMLRWIKKQNPDVRYNTVEWKGRSKND